MLSRLKGSARRAFRAQKSQVLIRLLEGFLSTTVLAIASGGRELGLAPAFGWVGGALFLVLVLSLSLGWDDLTRPIWNSSGWGWYPAGLMAGGALLWPVRLLWGAPANGYAGSEQLPLMAHLLFWGSAAILVAGILLVAYRKTEEDA